MQRQLDPVIKKKIEKVKVKLQKVLNVNLKEFGCVGW